MATVLGLFLGGAVTAIPVVTGVAEGVSYQKKQNEEAQNQTRMIKFNMEVYCDSGSRRNELDEGIVVLRHDKAWIVPQDPETKKAIPPVENMKPPLHSFAGFYIQYPDDDRCPPERGLVSTISDDPPMLNWLYVDKDTLEVRYGNRTQSIKHIVGEWDWTEDESEVILEGWEGFMAVDEGEDSPYAAEGLRWAIYYDKFDDGLGKGKRVGGKPRLEINLGRRVQSDEEQLKQLEEANKKMQVKSAGDLKTQFTAPAAEKKRQEEKKNKSGSGSGSG